MSSLPRSRLCALAVASLLLPSARASGHDIPRDVTVQAFARPEGGTFRLLVRVPLKAIMDIEFPRKERDYVDIPRADQALRDAARVWLADKIELYEGDARIRDPGIVAVRMSLESDRSFATYDAALAHVTGPPLPPDTTILWEQGLLDVLFEYPIRADRSAFSIHAAFDRLGLSVLTVLRFLPPGGAVRAFELQGDAGLVRLDPRWHQAARRFVTLGFFHILGGVDHLLFLVCLVIPFRRARALILIATAFTVAHSVTLLAAAYNYAPDALWFPPLIETLIAMSIVYMALENIVAVRPARRWIITFVFGLVHGFGFSFGLQHTLQFAGSHLVISLLSFNVGIELGQLLVLAVLAPALGLLFRFGLAERMGVVIVSALVAHTGWHWMVERFDVLRQFPWPVATAAGVASGIRWLILLVAVAAAAWFVSAMSSRRSDAQSGESPVGAGK